MNTAAADSSSTLTEKLELVRKLAEHKPISPDLVLRRLKIIGTILGLSGVAVAVTLMLIGLDVPASEPARLLTAFGLVAAIIAMFSALMSACILLWGGFVSQYVSALDAKADAAGSFDESVAQVAQAQPARTNEELVQTITDGVVIVAAALAEKLEASRATEGRKIAAELRATVERMKELEHTLNPAEQEQYYDSLHSRIAIMRTIQLRKPAAVKESTVEEPQVPLVG